MLQVKSAMQYSKELKIFGSNNCSCSTLQQFLLFLTTGWYLTQFRLH